MANAFFVTGTDTAVGKTRIALALLHGAKQRGSRILGLKPVAAGCEQREKVWANDDAWDLMQVSDGLHEYRDINPVALREAMAPHIAAQREQRVIAISALIAHCRPLLASAEFSVIEGAGGWLVPLNDQETMADLAVGLNVPVVLVVGMRLGCINHALLSSQAIENAGLTMAGWIANCIDPTMPVRTENITALKERIRAPLLGIVPWLPDSSNAEIANHLNIEKLLTPS